MSAIEVKSLVKKFHGINAAQQGGFTRAAGADDCHHFAFLHLQVDTVEHRTVLSSLQNYFENQLNRQERDPK
jgi:hypothetical protein